MVAISADSAKSGSLRGPRERSFPEPEGDECLEVASGASLYRPGQCTMVKRPGRVLCFSLKRGEFDISSRVWSPKIFTSGLWSMKTTRLSHPWVKYRIYSRPHAAVRSSPSMARYRCSAEERNRETASVIFHPSWQQSGTPKGQLQCCWCRKYPMPWLDQSGQRQVRLFKSKISTPSQMASTVVFIQTCSVGSGMAWKVPLCHAVVHSLSLGWQGQTSFWRLLWMLGRGSLWWHPGTLGGVWLSCLIPWTLWSLRTFRQTGI